MCKINLELNMIKANLSRFNSFEQFLIVIFCLMTISSCSFANKGLPEYKHKSDYEFSIDISHPTGHIFDIEFLANSSRLDNLVKINNKAEMVNQLQTKPTINIEKGILNLQYPYFSRVRIGNLFFGYSCINNKNPPFQEMVVKDINGNIQYNFTETIQLIEMVLNAGMKPVLALTGLPRALVPKGESAINHPVYGCTNAPTLDLNKIEPKERAYDWWLLQDAFFNELIKHFGKNEVQTWEFATWTEPVNREGNKRGHLILPDSLLKANKHDEAVATILAASIDAAMKNNLAIHIGNLAGAIELDYPRIIKEIRRFPKGIEYLKYIKGYAVSRYTTNKKQDIDVLLESAFKLLDDPNMPEKPLFIDEFADLDGVDGEASVFDRFTIADGVFVGRLLEQVFKRQNGSVRVPRRVAFWNNLITHRRSKLIDRPNEFLKTPAANVIEMFASLGSYSKVNTPKNIVAGVRDGNVKAIILFPQSDSLKNADVFLQKTKLDNSFVLSVIGLKPNEIYEVKLSEINQANGNPLAIFMGSDGNFLSDPKKRFSRERGKWVLASNHLKQCFYNELKECAWWEQAHIVESPLITVMKIRTDKFGALRIKLPSEAAVVMADISKK